MYLRNAMYRRIETDILTDGPRRGLHPVPGSVRGPMLSLAEIDPQASVKLHKPTASPVKVCLRIDV
jgi:hypothetical protein